MRATDREERRRERIENALAAIANAKLQLDIVMLRLWHVEHSSPAMGPVVWSAQEEVLEIREALDRAQDYISAEWQLWQIKYGYKYSDK